MGYNAVKLGRPNHVLHTFRVGNLRLVLNVQVSCAKQHSSVHAKTALGRLLDELVGIWRRHGAWPHLCEFELGSQRPTTRAISRHLLE